MASPVYTKIENPPHHVSCPEREWSDRVFRHSSFSEHENFCSGHAQDFNRSWKLSTLVLSVLLCTSLLLNLFLLRNQTSPQGSTRTYESGFETDLKAVTNNIELVEYTFEGGIELDLTGEYTSKPSKYVGKPSTAIDREWHSLLIGLNMDVPLSEAEGIENKTYKWENTNLYFTGLGVFHSLHCLNRIRQAFYPNYYHIFDNPTHPPREMHIDHCLDHIRQALQCHSDLTPMEWFRNDDKLILNTGSVHTCRNFDQIRSWAAERKMMREKHTSGEKLKIVD